MIYDSNVISESETPIILALDIGSSSVRAIIFDSRARVIPDASARIPYEFRAMPDGGVESDADALFNNCLHAIDAALARFDRDQKIAAVASACFAMSIVGVDADGNAVTPIYTYADSRGARQVAELREKFDERATHQRVGALFHTSYLPARILWLARERAEIFLRAKYWMSFGEYFYFKLLGVRAASYSIASWTGMLNRATLEWDEELVAGLPISREQLSPITNDKLQMTNGELQKEFASRWRALQNAKWFLTIGDGAAANLGSGCVDTSRIALTIGTSSAMRVVIENDAAMQRRGDAEKNFSFAPAHPSALAQLPYGLWSYRISRDLELIGGALNEGGNVFAWMNDVLKLEQGDREVPALSEAKDRPYALDDEIAAMQPDSHGLTVLPFLAGERAPNWNADARGAIIGLELNTRALDILRAGMEAVAYRLGMVHELLSNVAPNANEVIASGGALEKSRAWKQIIADVLNVPLVECTEREATARGVALLALKALGVIKSFAELPAARGAVYQPDAARHAVYRAAMERQKTWYEKIIRNASC